MHPCLVWGDIAAATVAVVDDRGFPWPCRFPLHIENVPDFGSGTLVLEISRAGIPGEHVRKIRHTLEPHRLVELAAVAIAGLGLFAAGGRQIRDVALRGTSADYLVDGDNYLLEVAGRSRRSDFESAWEVRWSRLSDRLGSGFFVCVCEFESPSARLAFR